MGEPLPPQNLEAEEYVIGAMMLATHALERCSEILSPGDFYRESHGKIYSAIVALYSEGKAADAITVADRLEALGFLTDVGGKDRIREIASLVPATSNAAHHARIVRELAVHRDLREAGLEIARIGQHHEQPAGDSVEEAERLIFELSQSRSRQGGDLIQIEEAVKDTFALLTELADTKREVVGLATGLTALDRITSGFRPGNLIVLAARPSMGKTAFILCTIANIVLSAEPLPVAFFTLEMSKLEVIQRLLSSEGLVQSTHVQNGKLDTEEWSRVVRASERLHRAPLFVTDASGATSIVEVRSKARRLKMRHPDLALVVIDYVQLMSSGTGRVENRNLEISQISRALKMLAVELQVPIVILSQLSRDVERRHDKRPQLSDLRDSGSLEQDADIVLMLYRDEYYFPEETENQGIAELQIAKQRNGPTGMRKFAFVSKYVRFSDLAPGSSANDS